MNSPALRSDDLAAVDAVLADDDALRLTRYPGDTASRQPVHTVYVPADRVHAGLVARVVGGGARPPCDEHAGTAGAARRGHRHRRRRGGRRLVGGPAQARDRADRGPAGRPRGRLRRPWRRRGGRCGDRRPGERVVEAAAKGECPPYVGVRFKSLEEATRRRGIRSLDLILGAVLEGGELPEGWVITLPKVTSTTAGRRDGGAVPPAGDGVRPAGAAARLRDPGRDVAGDPGRGRRGRRRRDGPCRRPAVHRACTSGPTTTPRRWGSPAASSRWTTRPPTTPRRSCSWPRPAPACGCRTARPTSSRSVPQAHVHAAWRLHARLVTRSLGRGFYQGWDLHPAQLPTRFLATYMFFRRDFDSHDRAAGRLPRRRRRARCSTSRRRRRRWPASWCAACTAARSTRRVIEAAHRRRAWRSCMRLAARRVG